MEYKIFQGIDENSPAIDVRITVFTDEQGFHDEIDDIDRIACHVIAFDGEKAVATGRLFGEPSDFMKIGRFAVLKEYRGKKVGRMMMYVLEEKAKELGCKRIMLSAQERAIEFYKKVGYIPQGEMYLEENYPHLKMVKEL